MIDGKEYHFRNVSLVLGGSGITPGYQLIARILRSKDQGEEENKTKIKVVDANKTKDDILLREDLDRLEKEYPDQFHITHVLSQPSDDWTGEKGHVTKRSCKNMPFGPRIRMWLCYVVLLL